MPRLPVWVAAVTLVLTGCSGTNHRPPHQLTVFAAASLTQVFDRLGASFAAAHPETRLVFSFAGSSALARQINAGAPADVFAAANEQQMQVVADAGHADGSPRTFATNELVIAVLAGNPAGITGLADFADPNRTLAICAPQVPCGAAAQKVFAAAGITESIDTLEENVRGALTKVRLGEVDAALVYTTDVKSTDGAVQAIGFPQARQEPNVYPIVRVSTAPNPEAAQDFIDLVLSPAGQESLRQAGFGSP